MAVSETALLAAVHEAAHAVVAVLVGCPPKGAMIGGAPADVSAAIEHNRNDGGYVGGFIELDMALFDWTAETDVDRQRIILEKKLMVWLAGGAGERRLKPDIDKEYDDHDTKAIYDDLATYCLSDDEISATLRLAEIRVRNLLARGDVWHAVHELAGALLVNEKIDAAYIVDTVNRLASTERRYLLSPYHTPVLAPVARAMITVVPKAKIADWRRLRNRKRGAVSWPVAWIDEEAFEPIPDYAPETIEAYSAQTGDLIVMYRKLYRRLPKRSVKRMLSSFKKKLLTRRVEKQNPA